jgi:maltooligosyltrehalose trehalohydrolase
MPAEVGERVVHPWERPLGGRPVAGSSSEAEFRVWAPRAESISLRVGGEELGMEEIGFGVYETVAAATAGDDYGFVVDGRALPDPCSRWQPGGLRGPSRLIDPAAVGASELRSPSLAELVIYELHVGTFTPEGTFEAAIAALPRLAALGVNAIELMPVGEFPGARGWGYDGVYISAAQSSYGGPYGLRRLVDAAHRAGIAVILDVVYNHLGASGVKAMEAFGPYFTRRYETPWGRAINYDDRDCEPVREWVCQSAVGWVRDFGIDGLRLDAIHAIFDSSAEHVVEAIARRVHEVREDALVIAESDLADPDANGGAACDAVWRDDFHHALHALLTGERAGYYESFGRVAQLAEAFARAPAERFVVFSQNHDQVGNRAFGDRMPASARPLAAFCSLLSPFVPLLFMGEEYGEEAPFQFFSDHIDEKIARATREGRRQEFAAFAEFSRGEIPDPQDLATFERSKLTGRGDPALAGLYERLLAARRRLPAGDADEISFDEDAGWLLVRRGAFELACNFSASAPVVVPSSGTAVELATHADGAVVRDGGVGLEPLAGALIG